MTDIREQKELASNILLSLRKLDLNCELLGGAPRNWSMGIPAKDLDFFLRVPEHGNIPSLLKMLVGETAIVASNQEYTNEHIRQVREVTDPSTSTPVQLILMHESSPVPITMARNFPCNVSKFFYSNGNSVALPEAVEAFQEKVLRFEPNATTDYINRMLDYFPDWEVDIAYTERVAEEQQAAANEELTVDFGQSIARQWELFSNAAPRPTRGIF